MRTTRHWVLFLSIRTLNCSRFLPLKQKVQREGNNDPTPNRRGVPPQMDIKLHVECMRITRYRVLFLFILGLFLILLRKRKNNVKAIWPNPSRTGDSHSLLTYERRMRTTRYRVLFLFVLQLGLVAIIYFCSIKMTMTMTTNRFPL
jgi:hypothetical protein